MAVAVVGANGFVGSSLVRRLLSCGRNVIAISREANLQLPYTNLVQRASGDLAKAALDELVSGADQVVNCAGRAHKVGEALPTLEEYLYDSLNCDVAIRLAQAAQRQGARVFVQLSSVAALRSSTEPGQLIDEQTEARPDTAYGRSKRKADDQLADLASPSFRTISLMPPMVYGPCAPGYFAQLTKAARFGMPLPLGRIANRRSFIYVGNLCDAVMIALDREASGSYIITDTPPMSTAEFYRAMLSACGKADRVWRWPPGIVRRFGQLISPRKSKRLIEDAAFDGSRFQRTFDWCPPFPFREAMSATMNPV